jgi:hypothetical protein
LEAVAVELLDVTAVENCFFVANDLADLQGFIVQIQGVVARDLVEVRHDKVLLKLKI